MEKRKLSDLNLDKCIYMSVGPHVKENSKENENFEDIVQRKEAELKGGWSLWADHRPPIARVSEVFDRNDEVYALMCNNGKPVKSEGTVARYYTEIGNDGMKVATIPENIHAVYAKKNDCAYALLVEDYYKIDEQDNIFEKGAYNRIVIGETHCHFNGFELLEKKSGNSNGSHKVICYAAKLRYPYCVKIAKEKDSLR